MTAYLTLNYYNNLALSVIIEANHFNTDCFLEYMTSHAPLHALHHLTEDTQSREDLQ